MEEFGVLGGSRRGDDWAVWSFFEDDVPHEPDIPPPPKVGDNRDKQIEGTGRNPDRKWRVVKKPAVVYE